MTVPEDELNIGLFTEWLYQNKFGPPEGGDFRDFILEDKSTSAIGIASLWSSHKNIS